MDNAEHERRKTARREWDRKNRAAAAEQAKLERAPRRFEVGYPERKASEGPPENKMLAGTRAAPENKAEGYAEGAVPTVPFASPAARARAEELGLTDDSFHRRRKSSDRGYTLADVERIGASAEDDEA